MQDVQFEEETQYTSRKILGEKTRPKLVEVLIRSGLAKNSTQAGHFLLILVFVFLIFTLYILAQSSVFPRSVDTTDFEPLGLPQTS